jgi:histidyl-tRNA synthetase
MGGPDIPAVGWAMGAERAAAARGEVERKKELKVYVISMDKACNESAFEVMQELRANNIPTGGGLFDKNAKGQMKQADRSGAAYTVFIGEDEIKNNTVTVRDLQTGEQTAQNRRDLVAFLSKI